MLWELMEWDGGLQEPTGQLLLAGLNLKPEIMGFNPNNPAAPVHSSISSVRRVPSSLTLIANWKLLLNVEPTRTVCVTSHFIVFQVQKQL